MATYSEIHEVWNADYNYFRIRHSGGWVYPVDFLVRKGGSWISIKDTGASGPRFLVRSGGLWVSLLTDYWGIEVCKSTPGTSLNEYTIPSSMFGLSVNKVILRTDSLRPQIWTRQYGGGTDYTHALTKNGNNIYSLTGKHDDGFKCSASSWSNRGGFPSGQVYYPGDKLGVKVVVPDTSLNYDEGGTRLLLAAQWYFN